MKKTISVVAMAMMLGVTTGYSMAAEGAYVQNSLPGNIAPNQLSRNNTCKT